VYPRSFQDRIPIWVAVGGTLSSAARAGALGLPMALAIIGGLPERFASFVEVYREAGRRAGHDASSLLLGINSHGYVADTSQEAGDQFFPSYAAMMNAIGLERGWPALARGDFEAGRRLRGALFVGSVQEVVDKVLFQHEIFGHQRFLMQISVGTLPHRNVMRAIELLGTEVAPRVRQATRPAATAP
jgi:alkanesulfonate monooxygenase SsuD/methylene tetrahydromethanopterin reductase-like flavin-dependent oxidoreductase (luciferase family)